MGVKFFAFFTEGVDKPSKQVFTRVFLEAGGREDRPPSKSAAPRRRKTKAKQKQSEAPKTRKKIERPESLMKREKRAKPYARTKKSTP